MGEVIADMPGGRASHAAGYMASDRPRPARSAPAYPPTIAFLSGYVAPKVLIGAMEEAERLNVGPEHALIANGTMSEIAYYRALARHIGATFAAGPFAFGPDASFPHSIQAGIAPITRSGGAAWLIAPRGPYLRSLLALSAKAQLPRERLVVTTPGILSHHLRRARAGDVARQAGDRLERSDHTLSAHTPAVWGQKIAGLLFAALFFVGMAGGGAAWTIFSSIWESFSPRPSCSVFARQWKAMRIWKRHPGKR